jgi:hypothetical protein
LAKKILSCFSFKVGNILLKSGGVNSKWKSNFDWRRKWNYQNEMNIEEYVGKIESGNVQIENSNWKKCGINNENKVAKITCSKKNLESP